jgi:heptosyltransferase-3
MKRRVLLIRLDAIGDFVLFTAALPSLRDAFAGDSITLTVHPDVAPLAGSCPYVDEVLVIDQHRFAADPEYARGIAGQVRGQFDIVVNTMYTRTWQSDNIAARTHAPVKIGFECLDDDGELRRRKGEQVLYTRLVRTNEKWMFELKRYQQLLTLLHVNPKGKMLQPELWIRSDERAAVDRLLDRNPGSAPQYAVLCPGAGFDLKYWSSESFARVADWVIESFGMKMVVAGSEKDRPLASHIASHMKRPLEDTTGSLTLKQFAALVEGASLLIAVDSAGFHIAWALGIPAVGIFGGGHFGRFTPPVPHVRIVTVPMECYGCYWHCIYDEAKCITQITPALVTSEITSLLQNRKHQ